MGSRILNEVKNKQASENTKAHCIYDHFFLGMKVTSLSNIYCKSTSTITSWIKKFSEEGSLSRKEIKIIHKKFSSDQREWVVNQYLQTPIHLRNEVQHMFFKQYSSKISTTSISNILREAGMTWQKLERRAMQLNSNDIIRFSKEMMEINWLPHNLVFLDEVSFDNQDMLRKNGFGIQGQRLVYRGEFNRSVRYSLLCFLGVEGILETYLTEGTFTRHKFVEFCRDFALSSNVEQSPGIHSIWVMDGAKIHVSEELVTYFRSLRIHIIYLPAYAPFYNPIEVVFGWAKTVFRKVHKENSKKILECIGETMNHFVNKSMEKLFRKCGYEDGKFDPSYGLNHVKLNDLGFD